MKAAARSSRSLLGFTLVELIVVITILVILGTIAFVSLGGFSGSARDSSRVSDLSLIGKGLDIHYTKLWSFPAPTSSTGITFGSSSSVVWYQGTIGEWVIRSLGWAWARISTKPVDPLSKEEYRYSLPTGVNEYLLAADYEGDSVALLQNWELRAQNWGTPDGTSVFASAGEAIQVKWPFSFFSSIAKNMEDVTGIATLRSRWQDFTSLASASTGSPTISYLKGTYNGVATRVSSGSIINIIALPSIFLSSGSTGTIVDASSRNFLLQGKSLSWVSFAPKVVYSSGALPSNDTERLLFSSGIVAAYSGTSLATNSDIKSFIDNVNSTGSLSAIGGNFVRNKFGGNGPSIVATASSGYTPYPISNSLRFNGTNSYLTRTPSVPGNQKKWTWSGWVKRGEIGVRMNIITGGFVNSNDFDSIEFNTDDTLQILLLNGGINDGWVNTNAAFRDPSSWYHIVVAIDTTQSTPTNMVKIYVNWVLQTHKAGSTYPGVNNDTNTNLMSATSNIGQRNDGIRRFGGYLADVSLVDSWALDASAFWQTNPTTGQWEPKQYTGSYGTNGFHLDFSSGANLWADSAPIDSTHTSTNNWTSGYTNVLASDWTPASGSSYSNFTLGNGSYSEAAGTTAVWYNMTLDPILGDFGFKASRVGGFPIWQFDDSTHSYQIQETGVGNVFNVLVDEGSALSISLTPSTVETTVQSGVLRIYADSVLKYTSPYTISGAVTVTAGTLIHGSYGTTSVNNVQISRFPVWTVDTPTNNFATLNPAWTNATLSEGNLRSQSSGGNSLAIATIPASATDDWYWEVTVRALSSTVAPGNSPGIGITNNPNHGLSTYLGGATSDYAIWQGGQIWYNSSAFATYTAPAVNDVLAFRLYNGSLYIGKVSGGVITWMNSGAAIVTGLTGNWFPAVTVNSWSDVQWNFWQKPWATSTLPGTSKSLSTTNLPAWSIMTSGSFTANNLADGPFVWTNGTPTTLSIGGNPVTWWNQADKLANGFKLRVNTAGYNDGTGTKNFTVTTGSGNVFKYANAQSN